VAPCCRMCPPAWPLLAPLCKMRGHTTPMLVPRPAGGECSERRRRGRARRSALPACRRCVQTVPPASLGVAGSRPYALQHRGDSRADQARRRARGAGAAAGGARAAGAHCAGQARQGARRGGPGAAGRAARADRRAGAAPRALSLLTSSTSEHERVQSRILDLGAAA